MNIRQKMIYRELAKLNQAPQDLTYLAESTHAILSGLACIGLVVLLLLLCYVPEGAVTPSNSSKVEADIKFFHQLETERQKQNRWK